MKKLPMQGKNAVKSKAKGVLMEFKLDKKEIAAIAIIFFAVLGILHYPSRSTLPDFSEAISIQGAMAGSAAPMHSQLAAQLVPAYASLSGLPANSPDAIAGLLLELSPLLLSITAVIIYAALRQFPFRRSVAAFMALLVSLLLAFQFLPGIYGGAQLAAPLFALFLLCMCIYSKGKPAALLIATVFAALSSAIFPAYAAAGFAVCVSFAWANFSSKEKIPHANAAMPLVPLFAFLAMALFVIVPSSSAPSIGNIPVFFSQYSLLLAFSALLASVFLLDRSTGSELAIMAIFGILASVASPMCAVFALVIPSAYGLQAAIRENLPKNAKLLCAFAFGFFAVFSLVYSGGDALRATAISFMVAILLPLLMHFYDYQNGRMFALLSLAALVFSVCLLAISQFSAGSARHVDYADPGFSQALLSISKSSAASELYMMGDETMARFYLPAATMGQQEDFRSFLATGKPALAQGSAMLLSPAYFDGADWAASGAAFIAYRFNSNVTAKDGSKYAIFASDSGGGVLRPLDSEGSFALRDGSLLDSSGQQYFTIPFSRMVMLQNSLPYSSDANRLIVLEEGAKPPYASDIFSGKAAGITPIGTFGQVAIYKVD